MKKYSIQFLTLALEKASEARKSDLFLKSRKSDPWELFNDYGTFYEFLMRLEGHFMTQFEMYLAHCDVATDDI